MHATGSFLRIIETSQWNRRWRGPGCCVYVRNDLTCSHTHALESSEFSTIWLRLNSHSLTKFICAVYLSSNSSDYRSPKVEVPLAFCLCQLGGPEEVLW
ncbi:hypothetical protein E2C01_078877 [Portunus trituberculatus]|uniref:Uncharacterized protein n=1 Tax=Portunus trituberculatus TaxID=210409 RepID=A0A5B7IPW4_PORTR|nr:hypothetical protein [Portunus trituberculatus]